jgi:hypothetical protein
VHQFIWDRHFSIKLFDNRRIVLASVT